MDDENGMRVEDPSGDEATVYRAVAELEDDAAARRTGLDLERTRSAVHRLLHTELKVLHEVPDTSGTDLGPVYELARAPDPAVGDTGASPAGAGPFRRRRGESRTAAQAMKVRGLR